MKKFIFILLVLFSLFFLNCGWSNCVRESGNWGNSKSALKSYSVGPYTIDYLFMIPETGVRVYRFIDNAHTRYVAIADNMLTTTNTDFYQKDKNTAGYNETTITTLFK